jgi:arabinogalactan endo-1,4-beta-galactosidase
LEIRGVDISSLPQVEDCGGAFYDDQGRQQDIFTILGDHGINYIRVKLWHTPANEYNDLEHVKAMALRIKGAGMGFLLDFHYSDKWADPAKQYKPAAWKGLTYEGLQAAVRQYTAGVLSRLLEQGTDPDIVQIGNEIPNGMLWDDGKLDGSADQHTRLAGLLKAGIDGVKDAGAAARIMLHLDQGGNNALYVTWFDGMIAEGVEFDVIGLSFYPWWHGELSSLEANMADLAARYGKDMIVVETSYAYTPANEDHMPNIAGPDQQVSGYPISVEGQASWLRDIMNVVSSVPDGLGKGVLYWEPAWLAVPGCGWNPEDPASGNEWENQTLFDSGGKALPSMAVFLEFAGAEERR